MVETNASGKDGGMKVAGETEERKDKEKEEKERTSKQTQKNKKVTRKGSGGKGAEISQKRSVEEKKRKGRQRRKKRKVTEKGKEDGVWGEWEDGFPHFDDQAKFRRSQCGFGKCSEQRKMEVPQSESKTVEGRSVQMNDIMVFRQEKRVKQK